MSRRRNYLHRKHLKQFTVWCKARGWTVEPNKGPYDALRLRHPDVRDPAIVYERNHMPHHFTVVGMSEQLARAFLEGRNTVHPIWEMRS